MCKVAPLAYRVRCGGHGHLQSDCFTLAGQAYGLVDEELPEAKSDEAKEKKRKIEEAPINRFWKLLLTVKYRRSYEISQ